LHSSGLLPAAFRAVAMTTRLAHFVIEIIQVRKSRLACGEKCNAFFILAGSLADPELFICNEYIFNL
jgi:hypothetical protein